MFRSLSGALPWWSLLFTIFTCSIFFSCFHDGLWSWMFQIPATKTFIVERIPLLTLFYTFSFFLKKKIAIFFSDTISEAWWAGMSKCECPVTDTSLESHFVQIGVCSSSLLKLTGISIPSQHTCLYIREEKISGKSRILESNQTQRNENCRLFYWICSRDIMKSATSLLGVIDPEWPKFNNTRNEGRFLRPSQH